MTADPAVEGAVERVEGDIRSVVLLGFVQGRELLAEDLALFISIARAGQELADKAEKINGDERLSLAHWDALAEAIAAFRKAGQT